MTDFQAQLNGAIDWGFRSGILKEHKPGSSDFYFGITTDQAIELHKQWHDKEKEWFYLLCEHLNYHSLSKFLQRKDRDNSNQLDLLDPFA